jgi:hypothetical protein
MRTGATFDSLAKNPSGQSRIAVVRGKGFTDIFDSGWEVRLDGNPMGDLKTGTFVYRDRPAGRHLLSFQRLGDLSRASQLEVTTAPGRTYVYRLDLNEKGRMITASTTVLGLTGMFVASAVSDAQDDRGLFDFVLLDDVNAREALAEVRLSD